MKIHKSCLVFLQPSAFILQPYFLLVLAMLWGSTVAAVDRESLRFHLSFESKLQPCIAGANTQLKFVKGAEKDAQWVEGRRGQGLKVTPAFNLKYLTRESFAPKEGTIALWIKPVGWNGPNSGQRHFLTVYADRVRMTFYIYHGAPYFLIADDKKFQLVGGRFADAFAKEPFPEGQWTFLAGTYKPGAQAFYINGQFIGQLNDNLIEPEFITRGDVEIRAGDQVLDEIMIFKRALTAVEIASLYRANAPNR